MMSSVWDMLILRFGWDIQVVMSGKQLDVWSIVPDSVREASECGGNRIH